jgi:iron complex outermembrane receptor protein
LVSLSCIGPRRAVAALVVVVSVLHFGVAPDVRAEAAAASGGVIEEVVVTGSYIRGTPEDAALPVDVITAESLQEQGSPDIIEMIQRIPAITGGTYGQSNRFLGTSAQGAVSVNLRGLGAPRTLVLLNGQRLSTTTVPGGAEQVDVAQIPFAAIGRVEVLRDGAAVTYGSDAVAGVVNFITRTDLEGFEATGSFTSVDDSDGDYDASIAYGWNNDSGNILFAADYSRTSEVRLYDFDFMLPKPPGQGDGISLAANPGTYFTVANPVDTDGDGFLEPGTAQGTVFRDLGCSELGAFTIGTTSCTYPFVQQESPVNDEKRYHLFGEVNWDFSDTLRFHLESHYARNNVPSNKVSVSLSSTQFPTPIELSGGSQGGGTSPFPAVGGEAQSRFYVPANNPGLVSLMTDGGCPYDDPAICAEALANGVVTSQTGWRPRALGGAPLFDGDTERQQSKSTAWRISAGFDGDLANGWNWTTRLTYAQETAKATSSDLAVNRVQLGLRGLGGEGCDPETGTPGVGPCEWFNPFANSITRSIVNGLSYEEATGRPLGQLNSKELWAWMRTTSSVEIESELVTAEAVLVGDLGSLELPAGEIDWVLGTQWRYEHRTVMPSDTANPVSTPCVDSPPFGDGFPTCTVPGVGPLLFNGPTAQSDLDRDVPSIFAELKLPLLEDVELGIAGRYEDYSGGVGSTTDYRVSLRWEALPWLVFRGSTGTTFRAPPLPAVTPGTSRIQAQFSNPVDGSLLYRPVDRVANPGLKPETAETLNVGFVIATEDLEVGDVVVGRFDASVDYYNVKFEKEIAFETAARVYGALFPSADPAAWGCGNDALRDRFTFTTSLADNTFDYNGADAGGVFPECHPNNFLAISTEIVNGREETEVKGLDLTLTWTRDEVFGGELSIGAEASYLDEWTRGNQYLAGTDIVFEAATDRAGTAELLSGFFSYPKWRGNGHVNYRYGRHNVHIASHFYQGVEDRNRNLEKRDDHLTHDVTYQVQLPWEAVVTATIANLTDEEPPYIRSQYNYDYMNYSPLGRTYKIGFKKSF